MGQFHRSVIFKFLAAGTASIILSFLILFLFDEGSNPVSLKTYDTLVKVRSYLRKNSYSDPFIVILKSEYEGADPEEAVRSWIDAVDVCAGSGVRGIFFSSIFRSDNPLNSVLVKSLEKIPVVITGGYAANTGNQSGLLPLYIKGAPPPQIPSVSSYISSQQEFSKTKSGFLNIDADKDGKIRRLPLVMKYKSGYLPSAVLSGLLSFYKIPEESLTWSNNMLHLGEVFAVPVDTNGCMLLDYPFSWENSFISYDVNVISGILPDKDKIALLRQEFHDSFLFFTDTGPSANWIYGPNGDMFPAESIAPIAVNQIVQNSSVVKISGFILAVLFVGFSFFAAIISVLLLKKTNLIWIIPLVSIFVVFVFVFIQFVFNGLFIDPLPFFAYCVLFTVGGIVWNTICSIREKHVLELKKIQESLFIELGQKSAGVTHGLKSQTALALNFVNLLETENLSLQGRKELLFLKHSIEDITASLNEIMRNFLCPEKKVQEVDICSVFNSFYTYHAKQRDSITTKLFIPSNPIMVKILESDILRILEIFFTNAIESGTELIDISLQEEAEKIQFIVTDYGCGILECSGCNSSSCMKCNSIKMGKTTKENGIGFGLFFARRIILNYNGVLYIKSKMEQGTTVIVELPRTINK